MSHGESGYAAHEAGSSAVPSVPARANRSAFAEPWEAQAFALVLCLSSRGCYSWTEWSAALSAALKMTEGSQAANDGSTFYHCWLAALENLLLAKGIVDSETLTLRKAEWVEAFNATPHGRPVELSRPARLPQRDA